MLHLLKHKTWKLTTCKFRSYYRHWSPVEPKTRIQEKCWETKCWEIVQSTHKTEIVGKTAFFLKVIYSIRNPNRDSPVNSIKHLRKKNNISSIQDLLENSKEPSQLILEGQHDCGPQARKGIVRKPANVMREHRHRDCTKPQPILHRNTDTETIPNINTFNPSIHTIFSAVHIWVTPLLKSKALLAPRH